MKIYKELISYDDELNFSESEVLKFLNDSELSKIKTDYVNPYGTKVYNINTIFDSITKGGWRYVNTYFKPTDTNSYRGIGQIDGRTILTFIKDV